MSNSIIDVHTHPLLPIFVRLVAGESGSADGVTLPPWSIEQHIEVMDRHGIGVGMMSLPHLGAIADGSQGRAIVRKINEELAAIVAQYPSRFGAFAVVPLDDMDAAIEEMAYALDVLKLDGVGVGTHRNGKYLGEPEYDPWFDEMNRRGVTLFVHPIIPDYFNVKTSRINVSVLEFMFDSTRMVTNLVLSGTKQRFDRINIISTHGGGTIPYLAHRISVEAQMPWAYRDGVKLSVEEILVVLGSFYYDLTASTATASLDAIGHLVPSDRLLMGFDFPMMPKETISPAIATFSAQSRS
jgi:6-methylsalicylate decarboxylase